MNTLIYILALACYLVLTATLDIRQEAADLPADLGPDFPLDTHTYRTDVASESTLTILNGNLWMLPDPFSVERAKRIERFVSYARSFNPKVITLQEIWTKDLVRYLKEHLPDYTIYTSGTGKYFNRAGLLTMTRLPVTDVHFTPFNVNRNHSFVEKLAGKGYLTIEVNTSSFRGRISNTHLYAPTRQRDRVLVERQFEALKQIDYSGIHIIAGDLNLNHEKFLSLNAGYFTTESDTTYTHEAKNRYAYHVGAAPHPDHGHKIDRIVIASGTDSTLSVESTVIREPVVSDHYMISYEITLESGVEFAERDDSAAKESSLRLSVGL